MSGMSVWKYNDETNKKIRLYEFIDNIADVELLAQLAMSNKKDNELIYIMPGYNRGIKDKPEEYEKALLLSDKYVVRKDMSIEKERELVDRWYNRYEKEIAETFITPFIDHEERIGQKFEIVRRLTETDADLECLPMWKIRFEDGIEIDSYPEEIVISEREKYI